MFHDPSRCRLRPRRRAAQRGCAAEPYYSCKNQGRIAGGNLILRRADVQEKKALQNNAQVHPAFLSKSRFAWAGCHSAPIRLRSGRALMRNPRSQRFWIPAFAGMTEHSRINESNDHRPAAICRRVPRGRFVLGFCPGGPCSSRAGQRTSGCSALTTRGAMNKSPTRRCRNRKSGRS